MPISAWGDRHHASTVRTERPRTWVGPARDDRAAPRGVVVLDPATLDSVDAGIGEGRSLDRYPLQTLSPVVPVGKRAADQLGLGHLAPQRALPVGSENLTVAGTVTAAPRRPEPLSAVMVVPGVGARLPREQAPATSQPQHELTVKVRPGAAQVIGKALPIVLNPRDPGRHDVQVPPSPDEFRTAVQVGLTGWGRRAPPAPRRYRCSPRGPRSSAWRPRHAPAGRGDDGNGVAG